MNKDEEIEATLREREKNLKDYYKYIYNCSKCKKKYGSDLLEVKAIICPYCELESERKKRNKIKKRK
jgi:DNA-directed RNA polymerase subunit RPC12/RpoP